MIAKFIFIALLIAQCSSTTNKSLIQLKNEQLNGLPIETARNLNEQFNNEQNVKLLNYLASLNRFNGQNGALPTNDQLLLAAATLLNTNKMVNNPNLANYQPLSSIVNSNNYSTPILSKPSAAAIPILTSINNVASLNNLPINSLPITNLPINNSPLKDNHLINNRPINNVPNLQKIVSNNIPVALSNNQPSSLSNIISSNSLPFQPISMNTQPLHSANRNMVNTVNNANKAFDLNANEDDKIISNNSSHLINNDLNPNYLTFNGENSMPEHWRILITGMQKFALNLIKSLHNFEPRDSSSGIILSPFSIWSTLVVSYMGAKTETEREMADVLHLRNVPKETVLLAYRGLKEWYDLRCRNMNITKPLNDDQALTANSKINFCSLANRVFFNSNLKLNKFVKENFAQETQSMDFVHEIEKSRQAINHWVEQKTMNKIKDLIAPGSINSFTNIVIANAIYFQAKWFTQFEKQKTIKGKFQVNPTEEITVNYMRQTANFMYGVSETIKSTILELQYSNQEFSMILILPEPQLGIDSLVKQIKVEHLDEIFMNLYDDEVEVQIPKFKFEQDYELAGPLYSMGMRRIFDPRHSDFSGFLEQNSSSPNDNFSNSTDNEINDVNSSSNDDYFNNKINKKVIINSVVHKAFISIDEEGTEAAAATSLLIARSGRPAFPSQFIANRPFLFLVRDTTTNAISFMGIVRRPSSD